MFQQNQTVKLSAVFTNGDDPFDPDTVTLYIRPPTTKEVVITDATHDSTGHYHYDLVVEEVGNYVFAWEGISSGIFASKKNGMTVTDRWSTDTPTSP
jgi:hypothetical protein